MQGKNPEERVIYWLTWKSRDIIKYDANFNRVGKIDLPSGIYQGWGITHDPAHPTIAYISDGTSKIFKVETNNFDNNDKQEFRILETMNITHKGKSL